jgi:hypothetical protein
MAELLLSLSGVPVLQNAVFPEFSGRKIFCPALEKRGGDTSFLNRRIGVRGSSLPELSEKRGGCTSALKRFMNRNGSLLPLLSTVEL